MTVKNITLLSVEEHQKYNPIIPVVNHEWWLCSPGWDQGLAALVYSDGELCITGDYVDNDVFAIRPALKLNLEISDSLFWYKPEKLIGTKIKYGNYQWTILNAEFGEIYVLCDELIAQRRFDPESNDWDASELKQWLETEGLKLITT